MIQSLCYVWYLLCPEHCSAVSHLKLLSFIKYE